MDAKPQRPARMTRIYGDENVAPTVGVQKTLHQRNKSSPALSSTNHGGGLKAAAKRTAFGDVSNTSNLSRPSKDDSSIGAKAISSFTDKPIALQHDKKSTALLRPAQRPLSVAGLKALLNNVPNGSGQVPSKQPLIEISESAPKNNQVANIRKTLTKKDAPVFKDLPQYPVKNALEPPTAQSIALAETLAPEPGPDPHGIHDTEEPHHQVRRTHSSRCFADTEYNEDKAVKLIASESSEDAQVIRSDGVYIENEVAIESYQCLTEDQQKEEPIVIPEDKAIVQLETKVESNDVASNQVLDAAYEVPRPGVSLNHRLTSVSETEDYWDEDDEDGYVTARSYKSRGENTMNGATTLLFPKMNQKVKRELAAAKELMENSRTFEELDDESWDTTMVAEYGEEIFQYMKDLEIRMLPNAHYMDNQAEIQWSMRSVLMDWLVQVHHRFSLLPETLFLCVNYIDRFLSCKVVSLAKLQLVGATAIFVAAKYEEINCPSVQEIVYMVDGGYTVDEILKAERFMLSMLQFELGWPGPMSFLRKISKADDYDLETRTLAKYFLEVTIMDERFVGSPPSFAAAGAHCLARMMLKKGNWSPAHVYYSNYTYSQLFSLVMLLVECCENPQKHHAAIFDKYADKRFKRASYFVETEMKRGFQVLDISTNSFLNPIVHADPYDNKQLLGFD